MCVYLHGARLQGGTYMLCMYMLCIYLLCKVCTYRPRESPKGSEMNKEKCYICSLQGFVQLIPFTFMGQILQQKCCNDLIFPTKNRIQPQNYMTSNESQLQQRSEVNPWKRRRAQHFRSFASLKSFAVCYLLSFICTIEFPNLHTAEHIFHG